MSTPKITQLPKQPDPEDRVSALRAIFFDVAARAVPPGARCALVDFPSYANVGDSAIWLGQLEFLRTRQVDLVYTCDVHDYRRDKLARRLGDGVVLLTGGGGFGDRYFDHQRLREQVVADFPDHPVVQLPQSIDFHDAALAERAAERLRSHGGLTLLVRDHASRRRAQQLGLPSTLCPDAAFALPRLTRSVEPSSKLVWLSRSDGEKAVDPGQEVDAIDWLRDRPLDRVLHRVPYGRERLRERLASGRLRRGLRTLSRGRVVVTDRLHGHILSLLLGIPHVVLDTANLKMRHFVETWTAGCELTHWADDPNQAARLASELSG
jgi:exopolysaccharide biosynthesis predicted pyruvyltransferase EpsI